MKEIELGAICEFINGGAWSDKEYVSSGIPVLKVSNFKPNGFLIDDINYLPLSDTQKYAKNKLLLNDVIIATVGSHPNLQDSAAGRSCVVNSLVEGFYLNQNAVCIRTTDSEILDQRYLGYLAKSREFQHYIQSRGRGAANQMRIAISSIKEYKFYLPKIEIQRRIADILSTYDDLIENNRKQIKLLEEAAQRLYKEWFVDLRFPGHEHTKIVDGVPEGWKKSCLSKIAEFKRGKTITKAQIEPGTVPVVAGGLEPAYYHNVANTKAPVITVSGSGANAGFTRMYHTDVFASDCSFIDKSTCAFLPFVYCFLMNHKAKLDSLQKGSAQPHVYAKDINALHICVPNEDLLHRFCDFAEPLFSQIGLLEKQNKDLAQVRDRLLPKLMSGEVEV